jgi:hypothetical protein
MSVDNINPYILPGLTFTPNQIIHIWEEFYEISLKSILVKDKHDDKLIPRQVLMYLLRTFGKLSYTAIQNITNRNHATVMHNCKRVEQTYLQNNKELRASILQLISLFPLEDSTKIQVELTKEDIFRLLPELTKEQKQKTVHELWRYYERFIRYKK